MPWYQTRQVAKLIGVNESTVRENTAGFPAPGKKKHKKNNGTSVAGAGNPASRLSGAAAAKAVESKIVVAIADHHATTARVHPMGCAPHETHRKHSGPRRRRRSMLRHELPELERRRPDAPMRPGVDPCSQRTPRLHREGRRFESVTAYQPSHCELRLGEADLAIYAGTRR